MREGGKSLAHLHNNSYDDVPYVTNSHKHYKQRQPNRKGLAIVRISQTSITIQTYLTITCDKSQVRTTKALKKNTQAKRQTRIGEGVHGATDLMSAGVHVSALRVQRSPRAVGGVRAGLRPQQASGQRYEERRRLLHLVYCTTVKCGRSVTTSPKAGIPHTDLRQRTSR